VDDLYFNVALNVNNGGGYAWQFLWPGEGESPQPKRRRVRAWNNYFTVGFRGISVQSSEEEWRFNIATVAPGARSNAQTQPLAFSNTNFLGQGSGAVVSDNVLARDTVTHRAADKTLTMQRTLIADPLAANAAANSYASVFGASTDAQSIELAPSSLSPTNVSVTRDAIRRWVSANRSPLPVGGWRRDSAGTAFIDPLHFSNPNF
jgi:hypothetical protein